MKLTYDLVLCAFLLILNSAKSVNYQNSKETILSQSELIEALRKVLREKEEKVENAEEISRWFEKMTELMSIVSQIDKFLNQRAKKLAESLVVLVDDDKSKEINPSVI
ncbi:hypothetical protein Trydic_g2410 [Trypoxylus dichotomus]